MSQQKTATVALDMDAWLGDARPAARGLRIYGRPDLRADMDLLEEQARTAKGDAAAEVRAQMTALAERYDASGVWFRVQARSDAQVDAVREKAKEQGVTDEAVIVLHLVADAIVEPAGITAEHLQRLAEVSEAQVKLLTVACGYANNQVPRL